jgi:CRISPR-associated protein Cst2
MTKNGPVFEISILARTTWNLHSLNNEGTVGNVVEPRTVVLADGTKTDGVSGEMLKRAHAYNVWLSEEDKSRFCEACQKLHPQKADVNPLITREDKPEKAMNKAIESCLLCDLHGFLVQRPAISRNSTVEFGWALGLPGRFHRDIHIHARHSIEDRARGDQEEVTAQMLYHRPTRSGTYALVSVFQSWRIGLNEVPYKYAVGDEERSLRYQRALEGYQAFLSRFDGAMTSTRLPHNGGIEGCIVLSETPFPAPVVSPISDTYQEEVEGLAERREGLSVRRFNSLTEAIDILEELKTREIYKLEEPSS